LVEISKKEAKEGYGIFEATSQYKQVGKSGYIGVKIGNEWYNLWGSIESINKKLQDLNFGDQVHFKFTESSKGFKRLEYIEKITEKDLAKLGNGAQELTAPKAETTVYVDITREHLEKLTEAIKELAEAIKQKTEVN